MNIVLPPLPDGSYVLIRDRYPLYLAVDPAAPAGDRLLQPVDTRTGRAWDLLTAQELDHIDAETLRAAGLQRCPHCVDGKIDGHTCPECRDPDDPEARGLCVVDLED